MEVTGLCFVMLMLSLMGSPVKDIDAGLYIVSDSLQYFRHDSVSFLCYGLNESTQLRYFRKTVIIKCKNTSKGLSCTIETAYPEDSGQYWCETAGGQISNTVNITVTDGSVILVSPVLQVLEGISVSLHCREKSSSNITADFYKDGLLIGNSSRGEMIIHSVSTSDEGLYKCSVPGVGESPESWLTVRAEPVILECPVLPLSEGVDVTLHCSKKRMSPKLTASFYKDGLLLRNSSTGDLTIHSVSKSDEGIYKCSISGGGQSSESWLAVRGHCKEMCSSSSSFMQVFLVLRTVFTILMVALLLLLLLRSLQYKKF